MRVAIVCDWLTGTGGAERVVLELHKIFPDAPIYTSQYDPNPKIWHGGKWFADADIRTTWLQKLPRRLKKFLPVLRALSFSRLDLSDYDLVISSSGAEAKAIKRGPNTKHIWYCLAPTHYYWSRYEQYLVNPGFGRLDPLARLGLRLLVGPLRKWDYRTAQKPDHIVAISNHIKDEVKKYYGREASVIFPPVDIDRFKHLLGKERMGMVTAGRQTPYKRIDLAVLACKELDIPLTVLGSGPEHKKLIAMAGSKTNFISRPSDEEVAEYFSHANGFIFPTVSEDFGITPVEALAAGTPVVAYKGGGPLDFINSSNGVFFSEHSVESVASAIHQLLSKKYDHKVVSKSADKFSDDSFAKNIKDYIAKLS